MKRLIYLLALILATSPAWATFTKIQAPAGNGACSGTTCVITLTQAVTPGSLLVFSAGAANGSDTTLSAAATGAGTMVVNAACHGQPAGTAAACGYILSSTGTPSSLTCTIAVTNAAWTCFVKEYSYSAGPVQLNAGATPANFLDTGACTTTCLGPALTIAAGNSLVVGFSIGGPNVTAAGAPYNGDTVITNGAGQVAAPNISSGAAVSYTISAGGHMVANAIAFSETGAASNPQASPFVVAP